jgi:hypothetical protein
MHELGLIETDAKLEKAVGDYVSNLATILKQSNDNLDVSVSKVLSCLKNAEFFGQEQGCNESCARGEDDKCFEICSENC